MPVCTSSSIRLLGGLGHPVYMRYRFLVGTRVRNEMGRYRWLDKCIAIHGHSEFDLLLVLGLNRLLNYYQASISSYVQCRLRVHVLGGRWLTQLLALFHFGHPNIEEYCVADIVFHQWKPIVLLF